MFRCLEEVMGASTAGHGLQRIHRPLNVHKLRPRQGAARPWVYVNDDNAGRLAAQQADVRLRPPAPPLGDLPHLRRGHLRPVLDQRVF